MKLFIEKEKYLEVDCMADDEVQEGSDEGSDKKSGQSNMTKIIIIVVALLIFAGGGAFAYFKFFAGEQHADEKKEEKVEEVDPRELIFPLDPFVVNLGGPSNFLKLTLQLEMTSSEDKQYLEGRLAPIRDSIVILLSSKTAQSVTSPEGKMQLKDDINVRINQALGKDLIRNVYFTEFVMQ